MNNHTGGRHTEGDGNKKRMDTHGWMDAQGVGADTQGGRTHINYTCVCTVHYEQCKGELLRSNLRGDGYTIHVYTLYTKQCTN